MQISKIQSKYKRPKQRRHLTHLKKIAPLSKAEEAY